MLFFLRKFIEALLLPIGISGLLTIAGVVLRRRWLALSGVVVLWGFSTHIVSRSLLLLLEHTYEAKTVAAAPDADAIVVLSGDVVRGITPPGVQWGDSASRYFGGFDLAKAGKAKLIVFTGARANGPNVPTEGAIMRQVAIDNGIQPDRIIVTGKVLTTSDEAQEVSKIPGVHSILLVTSAFHMPRAVLLFRARGLDVSPFPTDQLVLGRGHDSGLEFIPEATALRRSDSALREYYGLAVYRILLIFRPLGHLKG